MRALAEILAWAAGLVIAVACAFLFWGKPQAGLEWLSLAIFGLASLWVLAMGALHARSRGSVVATALVAALVLLAQVALIALVWLLSWESDKRVTVAFLAAWALGGPAVIAFFVRAKRRSLRGEAPPAGIA